MFKVSVRIHVKVFVYVVVGHRVVGLLQVLVTSPCRGGAAELTLLCSFVVGEAIARIIPHST